MYRKNIVYQRFSTVCDFKHSLGVLDCVPSDKVDYCTSWATLGMNLAYSHIYSNTKYKVLELHLHSTLQCWPPVREENSRAGLFS